MAKTAERIAFAALMGTRIRDMRIGRELSYMDVCRLGGIGPGELTRIEKGEREPSAWTLHRIAKACECEVMEFFPDADELGKAM